MKKIAFIGIDGAGKTTIIERVKKKLEIDGCGCDVFYMGLGRDVQLPFLKKLMGIYGKLKYKNKNVAKDGVVREGERDNYRIRNFQWLVAQYLDFWLRYLKARKSKKDYVFFDRYFYDGLVFADGKNFNFFRKFIPKIDLCFLIHAPADVIIDRKKEANEKNVEDFYDKVEHIGKYFKIDKIDNTRDIDVVVEEILEKIKNG